MATLRNKRKLAAVSGQTQKYPRNNQSQNTSAPVITEEYIAQVSEEIQGCVTKKLSQQFSRTKFHTLGALFKLDEILLNPQVRTFSETFRGTVRNADVENQEASGDRSQNAPHPKVVFFACHASKLNNSDPDETSDVVGRVQERIPYCSLVTFSGKQKKARSTSQPQFRSEITPTTIGADQIL